jgi:hypothetical protein
MSQVLGAFNFSILSGRGEPRITETVDNDSADTGALLCFYNLYCQTASFQSVVSEGQFPICTVRGPVSNLYCQRASFQSVQSEGQFPMCTLRGPVSNLTQHCVIKVSFLSLTVCSTNLLVTK